MTYMLHEEIKQVIQSLDTRHNRIPSNSFKLRVHKHQSDGTPMIGFDSAKLVNFTWGMSISEVE